VSGRGACLRRRNETTVIATSDTATSSWSVRRRALTYRLVKLRIHEDNLEVTKALRAHIEDRLRFALAQFDDRIGPVTVRLSDPGGPDKRCRIEVALRPRRVQVEDTHRDLFAAVNHATERLARSVARAIERENAADPSWAGERAPRALKP
jgi:putative sigma-54 modulation protein